MEQLSHMLHTITSQSDVVGLTIAELSPFDEEKLHNVFSDLPLFRE